MVLVRLALMVVEWIVLSEIAVERNAPPARNVACYVSLSGFSGRIKITAIPGPASANLRDEALSRCYGFGVGLGCACGLCSAGFGCCGRSATAGFVTGDAGAALSSSAAGGVGGSSFSMGLRGNI